MVMDKTASTRHKTSKQPPSYYKNLRQELAAKGSDCSEACGQHQEEQKVTPQEVEQIRSIEPSLAPIHE